MAVAEAGSSLELSLVTFADFSFKVLLYFNRRVLEVLLWHANVAGFLTQLSMSVE